MNIFQAPLLDVVDRSLTSLYFTAVSHFLLSYVVRAQLYWLSIADAYTVAESQYAVKQSDVVHHDLPWHFAIVNVWTV